MARGQLRIWSGSRHGGERRSSNSRLAAYQVDHGSVPKSLDELVGPYLHELPSDPYLGYPFRYFPNGMPLANLKWSGRSEQELAPSKSNSKRDKLIPQLFPKFAENAGLADIEPGVPGIWSSGPDLTASLETNSDGTQMMKYAFRTMEDYQAENWTVWRRGLWFPIPQQKH